MSRTYKYAISLVSPDVSRVYPGQEIPGQVCHEYLSKQAQKHNIADKNRYTTRVVPAERNKSESQLLNVSGFDEPHRHARRLRRCGPRTAEEV